MLLNEYLRTQKMTQQAFAQKMGVSQAAVSFWASGQKQPSYAYLIKIRAATSGEVQPTDMLHAAELRP